MRSLSFQYMDLQYRKSLLGPKAGLALLLPGLLGLLLLASTPAARAQELGRAGVRLSPRAEHESDVRHFTTEDTLHMWVANAPLGKSLDEFELLPMRISWRLDGPLDSFAGELEPLALPGLGAGLGAAFSLAELRGATATWTWSARVSLLGKPVAFLSVPITIELLPPSADFVVSASSGTVPLALAFSDRSAGVVTSWSWDFGDGAHSSEANPTHLFATPGLHQVTLTVSNSSGSDTYALPEPIAVSERDYAILYGMNASENVWSQRGIAFADAMARASEFCRIVNGNITRLLAPRLPFEQDIPVLAQGWPDHSELAEGESIGARLFGSMAGSMPDGREQPYVVTWEGTGSCRLSGPPVMYEEDRSEHRVEVFIDPTAGGGNALLTCAIDSSSVADPVRGVHVWLPGMEAEKPLLWPPFVAKLAAMNGGRGPHSWRAMDWNEVNQYGRTEGAAPFVFDLPGRITPASPSQGTRRGVCPEFQVALCNAMGANLHFNVPHAANGMSDADYETFLRDALTIIRDGAPAAPGVNGDQPFAPLAQELVITVEYSNEVWNPGFPVNAWVKARALENGRTFHQQVAFEIRRAFGVADEVFSGSHAARLQKYVGGWLGSPQFLMEVLAELGPSVHVDAAGPACYFSPRAADIASWTLDASPGLCPNCPTAEQVVESARLRIQELDLKLLEHELVVASHQNPDGSFPRFELYEGGGFFTVGFVPWVPAANQAQKISALYDAYVLDFVPALLVRGVDAVMWYSFISDGSAQGNGAGPFGIWDNMNQSITLPVPEVYLDEGVPKAAAIYRGPPFRDP